jgi:hypothetical protein
MSNNSYKIPCIECISLPICRHKEYYPMFDQCSLISDYIPNNESIERRSPTRVKQLEQILKPTTWTYGLYPFICEDHKVIVPRGLYNEYER